MSDVAASEGAAAHGDPAEPATQAPADERMSAGALLRQAREAAGVDLASLAVALKVSPKKLESLEADRLDLLPDAVFVRALASSVCRALKIDAAPVLARLPQSATPRLDRDQVSLNTPFQSPGDVAKVPFLDRLSRPMVLAALAVLLGALVLIFFPSSEQRAEIGAIVARPAAQPPVAPPAATVAAAPAASAPVPVPVPVPAVASAAPAKPAAPAPQPAARPAATAAAGAPDATPVSGEAPVRKRVSSTGVVVFKTTGPSWVEVTDGNGAVQLSRMVEPGDTVGASGPLPLNVTVGRADVTEVTVRGQPFPLEPVTRQGVARFEVK